MLEKIESIKSEAQNESSGLTSEKLLEDYRIKYLSRNGLLNELFEEFKTVDKEIKGKVGKSLNELKITIQAVYDEKKQTLESVTDKNSSVSKTDYTLPGRTSNKGTKHLINQALEEITGIFERIVFQVYESFEVEDEYHNFDALNTPDYHPSRDMQDTFYIDSKGKEKQYLLRTQTSSGQVRIMESTKPPIRVVVPGKTYRNEAVSARSQAFFHQVEGLYIDENVSFADLKQTLMYFAQEMFGSETKIRLRPSYFPFTEPSAEMDVSCNICNGKGCNVCKYTGWLEIMGCGMVDPNVLDNCGIDSKKYSGFAFGMGIERIAMLKYTISDLRLYFENDMRFLEQFK